MITLITGLPGNGKTLYALASVKVLAEKEDRPVYFANINNLKLPWIELDPTKWMDCPPRSIIVIDEVQKWMRPRMHGSAVPDFVAALETHRHKGVDLVLITQHPMLLDSNVRRLVGRHVHVVRKFGTQFATLHEWGAVKDTCDKARDDSIRHEWRYPADAFSWYTSAEAHTVKRRIPAKVIILLLLPFLIVGAFAFGIAKVGGFGRDKPAEQRAASGFSGLAGGPRTAPKVEPMTRAEYVAQFEPRVHGLAYTAPAYDEVTKPVRAPYPAACISSDDRCQCFTQQGTRLETPAELCKAIVAGGFFVPWQDDAPEVTHAAAQRLEASSLYRPDPGPGLVSLGGEGAEQKRLRWQGRQ